MPDFSDTSVATAPGETSPLPVISIVAPAVAGDCRGAGGRSEQTVHEYVAIQHLTSTERLENALGEGCCVTYQLVADADCP